MHDEITLPNGAKGVSIWYVETHERCRECGDESFVIWTYDGSKAYYCVDCARALGMLE